VALGHQTDLSLATVLPLAEAAFQDLAAHTVN
jgi:hypothetical protein